MDRDIAILWLNDDAEERVNCLVRSLMEYKSCKHIKVFSYGPHSEMNFSNGTTDCMHIQLDKALDTQPKVRNFVNKTIKSSGFKGALHVIEDGTKLNKDPNAFLFQLERMMDVLDYNVWLNTACDPCNFVYHKYCPRAYVNIDEYPYTQLGISQIAVTSHSNTSWVAYNFVKATDSELHFDEDFSIPMYYIIEFLARRKKEGRADQLYFMNQYLTVGNEFGVFEKCVKDQKLDEKLLEKEGAIFSAKNIKHTADVNLDQVMSRLYEKLEQKFRTQNLKTYNI